MLRDTDLLEDVEEAYTKDDGLARLARESARTESADYCQTTRIKDIMSFARRIGATKAGIAHCTGLIEEAGLTQSE